MIIIISTVSLGIAVFALLELRIILGYWTRVHPHKQPDCAADYDNLDVDNLPTVLIQLPIYNEPSVAAALVQAIDALRYPRDKLSVQLLDDSTDETTRIIESCLAEVDPSGSLFTHITRADRVGFKAGALQVGLDQSDAEFVAIFDADFLPPANFLLQAFAPGSPLENPDIAFLQGRWTFYNQHQNILTRVQSILIDRHFYIQKPFQKSGPLTLHFNGSGGIWRRSAIAQAGGWSSDTLCEDLDLTYRCALMGHFGAYDQSLECPSEIPPNLQAFKMQQRRWAKGSAQCARKLMTRVLKSPALASRIDDVHMLLGYLIHPLLFVFVMIWPWVVFSGVDDHVLLPLQTTLVLGNFAALFGFWSTYRLRAKENTTWKDALIEVPVALALAVTLMVNNTVAFCAGLLSDNGTFERTPKQGGALGNTLSHHMATHWVIWIEAVVGIYGIATGVMLFADGHYIWGQPSLFMGLALFGLLLVQLGPIAKQRWRQKAVIVS
ncbi:Glycosyltransferase, catalytic subunit of cellulose synthase and poly-beta-1,6-N-acetylglucosamine synthase [Yoonia tamlensis]|uniref:Glycosyltransferase, catalytic subunit of cellulose synthase and poly-beta-1,6-N-acetylglucosamine synthase n=1 Tax=Yoonia tamlensis TaxID=390270 RepID=A0A1I6GLA0_9RHOB|nr:glycosyltransferase family 2 protein [Yoonia tamlensis]SFR42948.1 Glycosyltransferase, catalytic subunit of cellulose synthase and poly-beta-1,6-N-acetylglucosamine synthase [Yoonia tamlensis]